MGSRRFKIPDYGRYDTSNGFGSPEEWRQTFHAKMGFQEASRVVGDDSPHGILGVALNATWNEIRSAYRKLAMQHHPDRGGDAAAFRRVQAAYEVLEHRR